MHRHHASRATNPPISLFQETPKNTRTYLAGSHGTPHAFGMQRGATPLFIVGNAVVDGGADGIFSVRGNHSRLSRWNACARNQRIVGGDAPQLRTIRGRPVFSAGESTRHEGSVLQEGVHARSTYETHAPPPENDPTKIKGVMDQTRTNAASSTAAIVAGTLPDARTRS
jgi:hypothetical protein